MFKYTLDNKRYHTFNYFLRNKFGCKVFKVPLDAHATCPNKINGGCIFCKDNSKSNITNENNDIITQFNEEIKLLNKNYFQFDTNGTNNWETSSLMQELNVGDKIIIPQVND